MGHFFMRMTFYFTARAFHHMNGIGGAGIEQDHTEFIAPQSAQNISMPDRSLHIFRKGDKSAVPRAMPQLVVKRLEIVDVGANHGQVPSMPVRIGDDHGGRLLQPTPTRSDEQTTELQSQNRI